MAAVDEDMADLSGLEGVFVEDEQNGAAGGALGARANNEEEEEIVHLPKVTEMALMLKGMPGWVYKDPAAASARTLASIAERRAGLPASWGLASAMRAGGGDSLCGFVSVDVTEPPTDAELTEMALHHSLKTRITAEHTKQLVVVDATAAPCQVAHELLAIDPDLDLAIDSDAKRFDEKWDMKVGMGWPVAAADMMTKYRAFNATETGTAFKFARVTFTQMAAGGLFTYRLDVKATGGAAKVAAATFHLEETLSAWISLSTEDAMKGDKGKGAKAVKADLQVARVEEPRVLRSCGFKGWKIVLHTPIEMFPALCERYSARVAGGTKVLDGVRIKYHESESKLQDAVEIAADAAKGGGGGGGRVAADLMIAIAEQQALGAEQQAATARQFAAMQEQAAAQAAAQAQAHADSQAQMATLANTVERHVVSSTASQDAAAAVMASTKEAQDASTAQFNSIMRGMGTLANVVKEIKHSPLAADVVEEDPSPSSKARRKARGPGGAAAASGGQDDMVVWYAPARLSCSLAIPRLTRRSRFLPPPPQSHGSANLGRRSPRLLSAGVKESAGARTGVGRVY